MAEESMKSLEKRGQVAIFIILGIIIVAGILIFFLWIRPTYLIDSGGQLGLEGCVAEAAKEVIKDIEGSAGFIKPEFSYAYQGKDIPYLCYTNEYYKTCTVQKPFLTKHFEESMEILLREKIDECYSGSIRELKSKGYEVVEGEVKYDVLLEPEVVRIEIDAPTRVGGQSFVKFNSKLNSPVYEMLMISTSIIQFEAKYGDSDIDSFMLLYPDYIVDKLKQGDGTTIYILKSKLSGNEIRFASRSLVFPAGYG
jgi:hypothetical protein